MSISPTQRSAAARSIDNRTPMAAARYFYSGAALVLLLLAFWGFDDFYLHGRAPEGEITPRIRVLVIVHGIVMTVWMPIFAIQPQLIARRKYRIHMALGKVGAAVAAAGVILGSFVAVESARSNPPDLLTWGLDPRQFLIDSTRALPLLPANRRRTFERINIGHFMRNGSPETDRSRRSEAKRFILG